MSEDKHPKPWRMDYKMLRDARGAPVGLLDLSPDVMECILSSVNSYDALVAACENANQWLTPTNKMGREAHRTIMSALALAKGGAE